MSMISSTKLTGVWRRGICDVTSKERDSPPGLPAFPRRSTSDWGQASGLRGRPFLSLLPTYLSRLRLWKG